MDRLLLAVAIAALAPAAPAVGQTGTGSLEALFPRQAPIAVEGEGLARLELPPAVLAECRPDLSDVRILDAGGRQVPYLVDSGRPETPLAVVRQVAAEVLDVSRTTVEREGLPDQQREVYRLAPPGDTPGGDAWELVVTSSRRRFVRQVTVTQAGTVLIDGESVFRLPRQEIAKERLALASTGSEALVVELAGEEGFYLEPIFRFERGRTLAAAERVRVPLAVAGERHLDRRSEIEVERPPGIVPDLLVLGTGTPAFSRRVEVWDEGPSSAGSAVGEARLFRVEAGAGVERLDVEIGEVRGDRLRVVIDNGDSPPLEGVTVAAAIRQPVLIFPAIPAGRLLFGGARADRPHYDLAALEPRLPATGEAAAVGERLLDPARLAVARLGEPAPNPAFDPTPALAFAMRAGSRLDTRRYSHRQSFVAEPSPEGLVRVDLGVELLAAARADLADLRVVDAAGHQWAYLLERAAAVEGRELESAGAETEDGVSRYSIALPVRPALLSQLVLHAGAPYFDRPFELAAETEEGVRRVVASGRLTRRRGDPRPLRIDVGGGRVTALELAVTDGDDAPLALTRVEGRFPVPRLYFPAPAGRYAIVAGQPSGEAPVYELDRVRDVVLAATAGAARLEPLARNPDYSSRLRLASRGGVETTLLWAAIVAAVAVLTWMTLRLARREEGRREPPS